MNLTLRFWSNKVDLTDTFPKNHKKVGFKFTKTDLFLYFQNMPDRQVNSDVFRLSLCANSSKRPSWMNRNGTWAELNLEFDSDYHIVYDTAFEKAAGFPFYDTKALFFKTFHSELFKRQLNSVKPVNLVTLFCPKLQFNFQLDFGDTIIWPSPP